MDPGPEDLTPAELRAEIERLHALLRDSEARHALAVEELRARTELTEASRRATDTLLEWYADVYEHAPSPYFALDGAGLIKEVNLTGVAVLGLERVRLLGRPLRLHVLLEDRRLFLDHMLRSRHSAAQVETELRIQTADGRVVPVLLLSRRASVSTDGGPIFRTTLFDLSERKRHELELQISHRRLELALAASQAGPYEYTWPSGPLQVDARWAQIFGHARTSLPPGDELRAWVDARLDPAERELRRRSHAAFIAGETSDYSAEFRVQVPSGARIWVRELARAVTRDAAGRVSHVVGVLLDISAERQRIAEAEQRTAQLRELSAALFRVEANERRELAALLHDDLGQQLVAVKLKLAAVGRAGADATGLLQLEKMLETAHQTIRSLSFQLSPPILHDLGLLAGLRWLARELGSQFGLVVEVEDDGPLPALVGDPIFLLFRCVRELLLNVVKHADVSLARVQVRHRGAELELEVTDSGVGFEPPHGATARLASRSFGLLSVQERIEGLGGRFVIDSEPGGGTRVLLSVPCADR